MPMSKIRHIVGDNIKFIREKKGMIQEELADKAKISRTHLGMLERGQRVASIEVLEKVAIALEISLCQIVTKEAYRNFKPKDS